ncbi:DUF4258 domain-containing protein [Nostoc sp. PCC 7524]|uniref:DUF4258 domain-containing protein n=1 Tax=Nostoc sp. (strain ATCC 29411 / PCC 7524) TaxID=28072 RepID=UPI001C0A85DB|nr:DUF4258 domain-containing protein [Nostoc sp. PCC 7524]
MVKSAECYLNKQVPRSDIDRIREKIRLRQYDMSAHAMEEMAEDMLTILDVEEAVLTGQVIRVEKDDPRGTKYIVVGTALDQQTPVGVVGRFASSGRYLIITVYEVSDLEG